MSRLKRATISCRDGRVRSSAPSSCCGETSVAVSTSAAFCRNVYLSMSLQNHISCSNRSLLRCPAGPLVPSGTCSEYVCGIIKGYDHSSHSSHINIATTTRVTALVVALQSPVLGQTRPTVSYSADSTIVQLQVNVWCCVRLLRDVFWLLLSCLTSNLQRHTRLVTRSSCMPTSWDDACGSHTASQALVLQTPAAPSSPSTL